MERDQQFLEYVVKELVDNPADVKVNRTVDQMGVLLTLDVNPADMGKIIGRSGNTAKAIRTLLRVVGMKYDARVNLKINEPEGGRGPSSSMAGGAHTPMHHAEMTQAQMMENREPKSLDEAIEDLKM